MTVILYGNLSDNATRNEIEAITRELRREWAALGLWVVSEVDDEAKGERRIKVRR